MQSERVKTTKDLQIVLDSVKEYYEYNALNSNGKNITVFQLLEKAKDIANQNVQLKGVSQ